MGRVLIDQQQAVAVLGDDVIVEHLCSGRAERKIDRFGGGLERLDANAWRGEADKLAGMPVEIEGSPVGLPIKALRQVGG